MGLGVGNPANTNALICSHYAPSIPKENFSAMTRLDQNRAAAQLAAKLDQPISAIKKVTIWGNHSSTQFPDASRPPVTDRPCLWTRAGWRQSLSQLFRREELLLLLPENSAVPCLLRKLLQTT